VLGLALKKGYLDIEFTTIPGDAANRLGSFIWRPYGEETSPRISATFGAYPGQTIYPTFFNHQHAGRPAGNHPLGHYYRWHSQFTEPKDFVADRWSQTLIGRWPDGSIVVTELPFYVLFLFSFYGPALRWFRCATRRANAE
jgi:hypothetical protein